MIHGVTNAHKAAVTGCIQLCMQQASSMHDVQSHAEALLCRTHGYDKALNACHERHDGHTSMRYVQKPCGVRTSSLPVPP